MKATIEQQIASIFETIAARVPEDCVAKSERPAKGASCKGMVSVYRREDLRRQATVKNYKACPAMRYVFYACVCDPSNLGSVAIYGDNAMISYKLISLRTTFCGHRIANVSVEMGARPFVDVKFAS